MNITCKLTLKVFSILAPAVTLFSSVYPGLTATFANAQTQTSLFELSHSPTNIATFTDTQTVAIARRGFAITFASAYANFDVNFCLEPNYCLTEANSYSQAQAQGNGQEYLGLAEGTAILAGYQFQISENSEFSFKFYSILNGEVSQNLISKQFAKATNNIAFYLFEDSSQTLLDFFTLNSSLDSANQYDVSIQNSNGFNLFLSPFNQVNGNLVSNSLLLFGLYSRQFSQPQSLTLITTQVSSTIVQALEPSTSVCLLVFGGLGTAL
ncbi:MAG: hypothetical protein ACKPH7_27465, partial [Planktothrix sp.]|uniref:hypothetical protein n=1 Tax=Planktothrix sp. TaxID=3088171 RepID=UPI0038D4E1A4